MTSFLTGLYFEFTFPTNLIAQLAPLAFLSPVMWYWPPVGLLVTTTSILVGSLW